MTSEIRANTLKNRVGLGTIEYSNTGPVISGVTTSNNFKTGSTNVHSVGVEAAGINVLGADTPIGTGATIYNSGAAVFTGIVTATSFSGIVKASNLPSNRVVFTAAGGELTSSPNLVFTGSSLLTTINTNVQGDIDIQGDIDVDGHTNLDNVSIAGVTTITGDFSVTGTGVVGDFKSTNNEYVLGLLGNNASAKVYFGTDSSGNFKLATGGGADERLHINTIGHTVVTGSTTAFNGAGPQNGLQMYYNTTNGLAYIGSYSGGGNTSLNFYTNAGGAGATQKLKITHTGHIVTGNLSSYSFNNDTSNAKIFEVTGDGTVGKYGVINISGNSNTDHNNIGNLRFVNRENSASNSGGSANSKTVAAIQSFIRTSDSNAGDDSGGYLSFLVKPEGAGVSEVLRIASDGDLDYYSSTQNAYLGLKAASENINFTLGATSGSKPRIYLKGTNNGQSDAGDVYMATGTGGDMQLRSGGDISLSVNTDNSTTTALDVKANGAVVASNFALGVDNRWKIRPNNNNNHLALEYATSTSLADTNIKAEFYNTGNVRFSTDTGAANGLKIYQNSIESQIYVPHFPELLTTGGPNPTGQAAGRMANSTISGNNITIPANTYQVVMAGRKFYLPALSTTTLSNGATLVFDLNTMSYPNEISGLAESTVERIALYYNATSTGSSTMGRIIPLCNKMTLMAAKRGYIGCTNATTDVYTYSSSGTSSMPMAAGDLWQTGGAVNDNDGSDFIRYKYNNNGYSHVDCRYYLWWGRSPRAVIQNQNEGYIITGDRDAFSVGESANQYAMFGVQHWASGGVGTCLDLALTVSAYA